jgi:transaldolase
MNETSAIASRLKTVAALGQQIWLDNLSRQLLDSGELANWIAADGVQGLTSNPSIFYNAIRKDVACQAALPALRLAHATLEARFEALAIPDVQRACDLFAPCTRAATAAPASSASKSRPGWRMTQPAPWPRPTACGPRLRARTR